MGTLWYRDTPQDYSKGVRSKKKYTGEWTTNVGKQEPDAAISIFNSGNNRNWKLYDL